MIPRQPIFAYERGQRTPTAGGTVDYAAVMEELNKARADNLERWKLVQKWENDIATGMRADIDRYNKAVTDRANLVTQAKQVSVQGQEVDQDRRAAFLTAIKPLIDDTFNPSVREMVKTNSAYLHGLAKISPDVGPDGRGIDISAESAPAFVKQLHGALLGAGLANIREELRPEAFSTPSQRMRAAELLVVSATERVHDLAAQYEAAGLRNYAAELRRMPLKLQAQLFEGSENSPPIVSKADQEADGAARKVATEEIKKARDGAYGAQWKDVAKGLEALDATTLDPTQLFSELKERHAGISGVMKEIEAGEKQAEGITTAAVAGTQDRMQQAVLKYQSIFGPGLEAFARAMNFQGPEEVQLEKAIRYFADHPGAAKKLHATLSSNPSLVRDQVQLGAALQEAGFNTNRLARGLEVKRKDFRPAASITGDHPNRTVKVTEPPRVVQNEPPTEAKVTPAPAKVYRDGDWSYRRNEDGTVTAMREGKPDIIVTPENSGPYGAIDKFISAEDAQAQPEPTGGAADVPTKMEPAPGPPEPEADHGERREARPGRTPSKVENAATAPARDTGTIASLLAEQARRARERSGRHATEVEEMKRGITRTA